MAEAGEYAEDKRAGKNGVAKDLIDYFIPWITRGSHPVCCFIYVHLPRSGMIRARHLLLFAAYHSRLLFWSRKAH